MSGQNGIARTFEDKPATREKTPVLVGIVGPSGTGKTFSALRLATGVQKVSGGDIFVIDTEANRSLHYADKFKFRHLSFAAPFGPLDYLAAIEHCVKKGAGTIVVDSMSHEHEGPGGVLEMHQQETQRLAQLWKCSESAAQLAAWGKPKGERRRLINTILQLGLNAVFCFRAKPKMRITKGKDPEPRGWQPIAGEEFVYEMTAKFLLKPGANGFPSWQSEIEDERAMMKLPEQFKGLFVEQVQLSEDIGRQIAEWAAGKPVTAADGGLVVNNLSEHIALYAKCPDQETLEKLEKVRAESWSKLKPASQEKLKKASDEAKARLGSTVTTPAEQSSSDSSLFDAQQQPVSLH